MVVALVFIYSVGLAVAQDWGSSPNNWDNSVNNWENSPNNWKNSPGNWENSPNRWGNERLIYDNDGDSIGYAVPKEEGGVNIYNFDGNRRGYVPRR
jgi:hypothetical protein